MRRLAKAVQIGTLAAMTAVVSMQSGELLFMRKRPGTKSTNSRGVRIGCEVSSTIAK